MAKFRINGIPQSIRDLHTVSSASGSIATFDTDLTENLVKCVAQIQAVQSGSGTPSPSNPRAISGFSNCVITANSTPVTIALGQTVYGGYLDVLSGVLTITHKGFDFGSVTWEKYTGRTYPIFRTEISDMKIGTTGDFIVYSSCYEARGTSGSTTFGDNVSNNLKICSQTNSNRVMIMDNDVTGSADDFKTLRTGQTIVYELATPTTVQLSSNQISTILGQNNILADTGDIDVEFLETVGNKIA